MALIERYLLNPVGKPPIVALQADQLPALAGGSQVFPDPFGPKKKKTGRRERNVQTCARRTPTGKEREGFEWSPAARKRRLIVVASSGGIDSTALLIRTRRKYPKAMILIERADTGHEPPDTMETLRLISREVRAPVVNLIPPRSLWEHIRDRGEIPNLAGSFKSCTLVVKGDLLDRFNCWIVRNRKNRTTIHLSGLLYEEPSRVYGQLFSQRARFGELMEEEALLYDEEITKAKAIRVLQRAGVPISSTYLDRLRHGCIPCKYWQEHEWRRYFQVDPSGFKEASDLEQYIERHGRQKASPKFAAGSNFGKVRRIWLVGRKDIDPEGLFLTEWLKLWDREDPGWRTRPVPAGLVRPEDISSPTATRKIGSKRLPVMGDSPLPPTSSAVAEREAKRGKAGPAKWHSAVGILQDPDRWAQALKELEKEQGQRNTPFPLPPQLDLSEVSVGAWTAVPLEDQEEDRWGSTTKLWQVQGPEKGFSLWRYWPKSWGYPAGSQRMIRLKKGNKWAGHVKVEGVRQGGEEVYVVTNSHLDETYRGMGLGSLMYLAARNMVEAYKFRPVKMISTRDYVGSGTSPMAQKVWGRLRGEGRLARSLHRGAVRYVSPRVRTLTAKERSNREVAYGLKTGDPQAVAKATAAMKRKVKRGSALIPVPDSKGNTEANLHLARSLARVTGAQVLDGLARSRPTTSNRERHMSGKAPLSVEEHFMVWHGPPLSGREVVFIDNVISSGSTFDAARAAVGTGRGLAFADARGSWNGAVRK